jgi:urea-proton symporter
VSIPAGVFSKNYFAFWVLVAIAWGFGAALCLSILPVAESLEDISHILTGMYNYFTGKGLSADEAPSKEIDDDEPEEETVEKPAVEAEVTA